MGGEDSKAKQCHSYVKEQEVNVRLVCYLKSFYQLKWESLHSFNFHDVCGRIEELLENLIMHMTEGVAVAVSSAACAVLN